MVFVKALAAPHTRAKASAARPRDGARPSPTQSRDGCLLPRTQGSHEARRSAGRRRGSRVCSPAPAQAREPRPDRRPPGPRVGLVLASATATAPPSHGQQRVTLPALDGTVTGSAAPTSGAADRHRSGASALRPARSAAIPAGTTSLVSVEAPAKTYLHVGVRPQHGTEPLACTHGVLIPQPICVALPSARPALVAQ